MKKLDLSKCEWHDAHKEKPKKNVPLIIVKNLAWDCSSITLPGTFDGKDFLYDDSPIDDVLEWSYAPQENEKPCQ